MTLLMVLAAAAAPASAQSGQGWDPTGLQLSRQELQDLLTRYQEAASSSAYSDALRARARTELDLIRRRLDEGDISIGDRVALVVEGHETLSETFTVVAGRLIVLPQIGSVPLAGVLRSELQPYLAEYIGRFIRDPVVHARSLIRLQVSGAVAAPGFYTIPSDVLVSDALMEAGGPQATANLDDVRIERGGEVVWSAELLSEAMLEGRTLDQLSIRAGDAIVVPAQSDRWSVMQLGLTALTGITSLVLIAERLGLF